MLEPDDEVEFPLPELAEEDCVPEIDDLAGLAVLELDDIGVTELDVALIWFVEGVAEIETAMPVFIMLELDGVPKLEELVLEIPVLD